MQLVKAYFDVTKGHGCCAVGVDALSLGAVGPPFRRESHFRLREALAGVEHGF